MTRISFILFCILSLFLPSSTVAQEGIVVGVSPELYDVVSEGVQGWNAAGVGFIVEPSGCGTGDVTFCYSDDPYSFGGDETWTAWWGIGTNFIYVSTVTPYSFGPATVCHELGHWLGLHEHRDTTSSCLYYSAELASPWPDDVDLANLGLSWVTTPKQAVKPEVESEAQVGETTSLVTSLPKTGSGPFVETRSYLLPQ